MRKILIIAIVFIAMFIVSCNKKSEKYILKHYTQKMGGLRYWHGIYHTKPHIYSDSVADSASDYLDTFEIKIVNNTTINIRGNNLSFNELNKTEEYIGFYYSVNDRTQSWRIEQLDYYYKADSIRYGVSQNHQYTPYRFILHTP